MEAPLLFQETSYVSQRLTGRRTVITVGEGLAGGSAVAEVNRTAHYQQKVQAVAAAQRAGVLNDDLDPAKLVFLLIALVHGGSPYHSSSGCSGADADDPKERARRHAGFVQAAQHLASPQEKGAVADRIVPAYVT